MNNSKLTITLDFKGRDELERIVAEIGKQHNIPVDIDISSAKIGVLKNINTSFKSLYNSAKLFTAQLGLAISGVEQIYSVLDLSIGSFVRAAQEQESAPQLSTLNSQLGEAPQLSTLNWAKPLNSQLSTLNSQLGEAPQLSTLNSQLSTI